MKQRVVRIPLVLKYDREIGAIPRGPAKAAKYRAASTGEEDYSLRLMMNNREELKGRVRNRYRVHPLLWVLFVVLLVLNLSLTAICICK